MARLALLWLGLVVIGSVSAAGCGGEITDPVGGSESALFDREDALQTFNRDVFVLDGSTLVNPTAETPADAQLFSVFGAPLPVTWGQFSAAEADSKVRCSRGKTKVRLRFSGLVPGGLYSVFYGTFGPDSEHPLCPGVERTLPVYSTKRRHCAAPAPSGDDDDDHDGDDDDDDDHRHHGHHDGHDHHDGDRDDDDDDHHRGNHVTWAHMGGHHHIVHFGHGRWRRQDQCAPNADFVADARGRATFRGEIDGCQLDATQLFFSIVYHFDNMSYGDLPNRGEFLTQGDMCRASYGEDAMRQLLVLQKW